MPKQVDREERRRDIAAAVLRIVTTRGVEAASLRTVAAEAGVSMGAVQHYFTTKDEMLRFALAYGNTLLAERGARLWEERKPADTARDVPAVLRAAAAPRRGQQDSCPAVGRVDRPRLCGRADPEAGRHGLRQPH